MEDMHIHIREIIDDSNKIEKYIKKCIDMRLERVVFLEHGNRISNRHLGYFDNEYVIDVFNKIVDTKTNKKLKIIKGIEIDFSNDLKFRKRTNEIIKYGNFSWIVGSLHSIKFDTLREYLLCILEMIKYYDINVIAHIKLDDSYLKCEDIIKSILEICHEKNINIEINTSDRARWNDNHLFFMLELMEKYNVKYVYASDAHNIEDIGYKIEETIKKVKTWKKKN